MSNFIAEEITVTLSFRVLLEQKPSGWWDAWHGVLGSTTAQTKEECLRILKQRANDLDVN